jgi:hypothetical protein
MKDPSLFGIRVGSLLALLLVLVVNVLANALPLNNLPTGAISDLYPNLFVPVGLTFSIWGIIYSLLLGFVLYGLGLLWKTSPLFENTFQKIGGLFILSCILNAAWIFLWHYLFIGLSVLVMIALLVTLIVIYRRLPNKEALSFKERVFLVTPFSIYLGWITVATIANITALLVAINWNGWGLSEVFWTVLVLFVGGLITLTFMKKYRDIAYGLVVVWAYFGIFLQHITLYQRAYPIILVVTLFWMVLILGYGILLKIQPSH